MQNLINKIETIAANWNLEILRNERDDIYQAQIIKVGDKDKFNTLNITVWDKAQPTDTYTGEDYIYSADGKIHFTVASSINDGESISPVVLRKVANEINA